LVRDVLGELCASEAKFPLRVTGVRSLGRGVAYQLASPDLLRLHAKLSQRFVEDLSRQDQQRFQPHIVVQNKVTPETARALLLRLEAEFAPWQVWAEGCDLWEYLGGPWRLAESYGFLRQDPDLQARAIV
jgi:2'-5' RNA ligase